MTDAEWRCLEVGCAEGGAGTEAEVDAAAKRHTEKPPKHATATRTKPVPKMRGTSGSAR